MPCKLHDHWTRSLSRNCVFCVAEEKDKEKEVALAELRKELEEKASLDAKRYQYIRSTALQLGPDCWIRTGKDLDEAVDAEMERRKREGDQT